MVTLIRDPFDGQNKEPSGGCSHSTAPKTGYDGYVEPDTKVPAKPKPVFDQISVNGVEIDEQTILMEAQQHPAKNPGEALASAAKALVVKQLLLQEAKRLNLKPVNTAQQTEKSEVKEDALIRALMDARVSAPKATEEERRRYYDRHPSMFCSETVYEARHILITDGDVAGQSAKSLTESVLARLLQKPDGFERAAKEMSVCPSKEQGGNLGQLTKGSTVPEFEMVLEKMEPGQIWPEPVVSRYGHHIIYLENKIPGELLPFDYVEDRIGAWLEASSWSRAVSQYISILAGQAEIKGIELDAVSSPLVQ